MRNDAKKNMASIKKALGRKCKRCNYPIEFTAIEYNGEGRTQASLFAKCKCGRREFLL